eukprot:1492_1
MTFESYSEPIPLSASVAKIRPDSVIINKTPLEQIRLSNDTFEYLYYCTNITVNNAINSGSVLEFTGQAANAYMFYIDDKYIGQVWDGEHTSKTLTFNLNINIEINKGNH